MRVDEEAERLGYCLTWGETVDEQMQHVPVGVLRKQTPPPFRHQVASQSGPASQSSDDPHEK